MCQVAAFREPKCDGSFNPGNGLELHTLLNTIPEPNGWVNAALGAWAGRGSGIRRYHCVDLPLDSGGDGCIMWASSVITVGVELELGWTPDAVQTPRAGIQSALAGTMRRNLAGPGGRGCRGTLDGMSRGR